jgi:uncharacterized protein (DUF697 family)
MPIDWLQGVTMSNSLLSRARAKLEREVLEIERRTDLTEQQKVDKIIVIFSVGCGAIAVQPIPFADIFILTPLQAYMGTRLAAIRGLKLSEQESTDLIKQLMGVVGLGLVAQQLGIAAAKILFPIFGGVATVPVVFGLTYAIGNVMDKYIVAKVAGRTMTPDEIKKAWKDAKKSGEAEGKRRQEEIRRNADKG